MIEKRFFAHLQRNGIHNALALYTFQARFDHFKTGTVDHHRGTAHRRIACEQIQKVRHFLLGVQKAVVHVHVYNVSSLFHLCTGDFQRFVVILFVHKAQELFRACNVATFTDFDKEAQLVVLLNRGDSERFKTAEHEHRRAVNRLATFVIRSEGIDRLAEGGHVLRGRSAAAADHVHQFFFKIGLNHLHHIFRRIVVTAELVRKTRVRVARNVTWCDRGHATQIRQHAVCA